MKDLYDITEGILDMDDTMDAADEAASVTAAAEWVKQHGIKWVLDSIVKNPDKDSRHFNGSTKTWHFDDDEIVLTKADKDGVPYFVHIDKLKRLKLIGYPGTEFPKFGLEKCLEIIIRNCPNLKSLDGCPREVDTFAITGCPKIKSLDGCPAIVHGLFKFTNNGISVTAKDITRKVKGLNKSNCIYDKPV